MVARAFAVDTPATEAPWLLEVAWLLEAVPVPAGLLLPQPAASRTAPASTQILDAWAANPNMRARYPCSTAQNPATGARRCRPPARGAAISEDRRLSFL